MTSDNKPEDKPIYGAPPTKEPPLPLSRDPEAPVNVLLAFRYFLTDLVRKPVDWMRENVIEPNRGPKYYYYHRKFGRALPVDECYYDDLACIYEATLDYRRGRLVDYSVLELLKLRRDNCYFWNNTGKWSPEGDIPECDALEETYRREEMNYFIKYGDLQAGHSAMQAYNKQKHRMIMDRRRALREQEEDRDWLESQREQRQEQQQQQEQEQAD